MTDEEGDIQQEPLYGRYYYLSNKNISQEQSGGRDKGEEGGGKRGVEGSLGGCSRGEWRRLKVKRRDGVGGGEEEFEGKG